MKIGNKIKSVEHCVKRRSTEIARMLSKKRISERFGEYLFKLNLIQGDNERARIYVEEGNAQMTGQALWGAETLFREACTPYITNISDLVEGKENPRFGEDHKHLLAWQLQINKEYSTECKKILVGLN